MNAAYFAESGGGAFHTLPHRLMELPSISVITPSMNAAATLQETLDSVRDQGYPDVEHIVVDGGSTDGTLELLESASGVRWVSEPDDGRVDAANKGLAMASGDVVAWLNADDRYEPGALTAVGEALARNPAAVWVTGYCRIIDDAGKRDPARGHGLQEPAAAPLVTRPLPHAELRGGSRDVRAPERGRGGRPARTRPIGRRTTTTSGCGWRGGSGLRSCCAARSRASAWRRAR